MQEGNWWMADYEPARRRKCQIVCCLLSTLISRGDVLEIWFLMDSKCNIRRCQWSKRVSLSGLGVEKKSGEDAPRDQTRRSNDSWWAKFLKMHLFRQGIVGVGQ